MVFNRFIKRLALLVSCALLPSVVMAKDFYAVIGAGSAPLSGPSEKHIGIFGKRQNDHSIGLLFTDYDSGGEFLAAEPEENWQADEISVLYSFEYEYRYGKSQYGLGLSWNKITEDRVQTTFPSGVGPAVLSTVKREHSTVGIPLYASTTWAPFKYVGIGVYVYSNINHVKTHSMLGFQLQIGHVRD